QFVAILGHDLRSPLGAILTGIGIIQRGSRNEGESRLAARLRSSAERMGRMIDQLLDLTRSRQGGGIPVDPKPIDIAEVTRRVVEEVEIAHTERAIDVEVDGETSGDWDPDRMAQVVSNLLGNAVIHGSAEREIRVHLSGDTNEVALEVHNEGVP